MDLMLLAQDQVAEESGRSFVAALTSVTGRAVISTLLATAGINLLLPPRGRGKQFLCGSVLIALGVVLLLLPSLAKLPLAPAFLLVEGLAVLGGLGTITSRSPVYSAIWFASSLLAVGALLLLAGAQFLGLATVAVYAGAIVVTFLFVLMLAQPEGHAIYDRLGWGWLPTLCASLAGTSLAGLIAVGAVSALAADDNPATADNELRDDVVAGIIAVLPDDPPWQDVSADALIRRVRLYREFNGAEVLAVNLAEDQPRLPLTDAELATAIRTAAGPQLSAACRIDFAVKDVLAAEHVAHLGGELFGRHIVAIQVAGVLLLVALVGAIAMATHGNDLQPDEGVALR